MKKYIVVLSISVFFLAALALIGCAGAAPTAVPPTSAAIAPTATLVPPTDTPVPPTATTTPTNTPTVQPSDTPTAVPTDTPTLVPPTATPVPPTATRPKPTATRPRPTSMPVPPTIPPVVQNPCNLQPGQSGLLFVNRRNDELKLSIGGGEWGTHDYFFPPNSTTAIQFPPGRYTATVHVPGLGNYMFAKDRIDFQEGRCYQFESP